MKMILQGFRLDQSTFSHEWYIGQNNPIQKCWWHNSSNGKYTLHEMAATRDRLYFHLTNYHPHVILTPQLHQLLKMRTHGHTGIWGNICQDFRDLILDFRTFVINLTLSRLSGFVNIFKNQGLIATFLQFDDLCCKFGGSVGSVVCVGV